MDKQINLNKYNLRTDIALEEISNHQTYLTKEYTKNNITVTKIIIDETTQPLFNKKTGNYITISFKDITDSNNIENVENILVEELKKLFKNYNLKKEDNVLIVGLGNKDSTPDALGPKVVDNILVTRHLFLLDEVNEGYQNTSAISLGVTGTTGIETGEAIKAIVDNIKPKLVIVVDSLASKVIENLNKTIQITTAGISPGSGIGNTRKEISKETLGVDVVAIGVPTVVDSLTIITSTFTYIYKYLAYNISGSKKQKLALPNSINYLKEENIELDEENKKNLLGMIGTLNPKELEKFIKEVIEPIDMNMIVTPKEVDFTIKKLSNIIGKSINHSLHRHNIS